MEACHGWFQKNMFSSTLDWLSAALLAETRGVPTQLGLVVDYMVADKPLCSEPPVSGSVAKHICRWLVYME